MVSKDWLTGNVLVVAHIGDIDACSSFVAFEEFAKKINPKAKLTFCISGALNRNGKRILEIFKFKIKELKDIDIKKFKKLLLLDTQVDTIPENLQKFEDIGCIDHHTISTKTALETTMKLLDTEAVSTTEIIYNLFKEYKFKISKRVARAIIYGLVADTAGLRYAKTKNFQIVTQLLTEHKLEYRELLKQITEEIELQERLAWIKVAKRLDIKQFDGKILVISRVGSFESSAAQKLMTLGADVALVISRKPKKTRIVGRSKKIDLAKIFIKVSEVIGGSGGGHPQAAVLNIPTNKEKEALNYVIRAVQE